MYIRTQRALAVGVSDVYFIKKEYKHMKKRTAAAFIAAMTITTLTACGGPKQLSKSVTVELGKEDGIKVTDVLDISKDKAKDVKIDTKKVNFYKEGKYDATLTYDKKEYKITVKIKDTVAPEATVKESITVQTGTAVHVTDCLDKVTEASGNIKAEFETKPETDNAQGTETTESTEKAETTESTDKSSAPSTEATDKSSVSSSEATDTQSQAIAVGDVNLTSNDEITYVTAGDYDNNIVVTDDAGNETKVPVKISVINPPAINGVTDKTVTVGDTIDYMAGVTATDGKGADITSSVQVDSSAVNTGAAGTYQAAYKVTDANGYTGSATSNVTVNEKPKEEPKEESKQEAADNSGSSSKSDSKKNNSSSKKHNSSSGSASSSNGGQSASNGGGSSSGGSGSSGSSDNGGGSSSGGSSSSNITPVNRADVPAGWKLVDVGNGEYIAANPNAGKYDTAYASNAHWGCWADGSKYTIQDRTTAMTGGNREAALYFVAAGSMDKNFFNDVYGQ